MLVKVIYKLLKIVKSLCKPKQFRISKIMTRKFYVKSLESYSPWLPKSLHRSLRLIFELLIMKMLWARNFTLILHMPPEGMSRKRWSLEVEVSVYHWTERYILQTSYIYMRTVLYTNEKWRINIMFKCLWFMYTRFWENIILPRKHYFTCSLFLKAYIFSDNILLYTIFS